MYLLKDIILKTRKKESFIEMVKNEHVIRGYI